MYMGQPVRWLAYLHGRRIIHRMRITFSRIKNHNIFQPEFENLSMTGNASIEFKRMQVANAGMAVVYAPNGTGKSSFAEGLL